MYRDPSAWYHFVIAVDTTQTTDLNKVKLYVNGVQDTNWSYAGWCSDDTEYLVNTNTNHEIGLVRGSTGTPYYYFDGYMAEWHCIDGAAKEATDFGETNADTGQWVPKKYTGTHGTNGFHFKFNDLYNDSGTIKVPDNSSNSNEWECSNITIPGTNLDVPCVEFDGTDDYLEIEDLSHIHI